MDRKDWASQSESLLVFCRRFGRGLAYDDLQGQAETQKLEASIARLEARILQLGGTLPNAPEVIVHEPHLDSGTQISGRPSFSAWSASSGNQNNQQPLAPMHIALPDDWWRASIPPPAVTKML